MAFKVLGPDAGDEVSRNFIVKSVEDWFDSCINEALAACIMSFDQVVCSSAFDWFSQDGVGVTVTKHEDIAVALAASEGEHAREVCACESFEFFQFECIDCDLVASVQAWSRWIKWFFLCEDWIWWGSSGSCSLSGSLNSAHDGGD